MKEQQMRFELMLENNLRGKINAALTD